MKKFALILVAALAINLGYAQKAKVVSAYNYLNHNQLDKAKEAIDAAITNEKTMADAKTWFYRGNVYLQIYRTKEPEFQG